MAQIYNFKLSGLTSASATIATVDVSYDTDGFLRFNDVTGQPRRVKIDGDFAALLWAAFTGVSGFDAGSPGVQGHRVFNEPRVLQ